jgi:hypothetical protein
MDNKVLSVPGLVSDFSLVILIFLMLCSMNPWFAWGYGALIYLGFGSIFILFRFHGILNLYFSKKDIWVFCLCITMYFSVQFRKMGFGAIIIFFYKIVIFFFVFTLDISEHKKLLIFFTRIFACIITVSLVYYFILFLGYQLPYTIIEWPHINGGYDPFINYGFLLVPTRLYVFYRFQSIFTEPGHLGMIASFLLYVNKYKIKKPEVFIILISLLLSFSLAAYLLLIFGYCIYQTVSSKKISNKILLPVFVLGVLGSIGIYMYINYPDHPITKLIINRMSYDGEKGISGNNRSSLTLNNYYDRNFINSSDIIWGMGAQKFAKRVSGTSPGSYKGYLMDYGLFGVFSLFFFYLSLTLNNKSKFLTRFLIGMFLLYILSFLQRSHYALWEIEVFLFATVAKSGNKFLEVSFKKA